MVNSVQDTEDRQHHLALEDNLTRAHDILERFDPKLPIEASVTPPFEWYTDPDFYQLEMERVFQKSWIPIGRLDQVEGPGSYFTGDVAGNPVVVARDKSGTLRAHHNVCRHKAAIVASQEDDTQHRCEFFQCPYHGWEYHLDGRLKKAPMLGPQENFDPQENGLASMSVDTWGPAVFVDLHSPDRSSTPRSLSDDVKDINGPLELSLIHI